MAHKTISVPSRTIHYKATQEVTEWAQESFENYRDHHPGVAQGAMGFVYVRTSLGTIEVPVDLLLYVTARMLAALRGEKKGPVTEITHDVVEAAVGVLNRIPEYLATDFCGMLMEAEYDLHSLHKDVRSDWRDIAAKLTGDRSGSINLELLRAMLDRWGLTTLEIDDVRFAFQSVFAKNGKIGTKVWKSFLRTHMRNKRRPGRPRNAAYDHLFEKRNVNPQLETYGKLVRELSDAAIVPRELATNRLKAAIAYRRKESKGLTGAGPNRT